MYVGGWGEKGAGDVTICDHMLCPVKISVDGKLNSDGFSSTDTAVISPMQICTFDLRAVL